MENQKCSKCGGDLEKYRRVSKPVCANCKRLREKERYAKRKTGIAAAQVPPSQARV